MIMMVMFSHQLGPRKSQAVVRKQAELKKKGHLDGKKQTSYMCMSGSKP